MSARGGSMQRYAAFLRGVMPTNAKMPELKKCFEDAGFAEVRTVLGSGNVVFSARAASTASLERKVVAALEKGLGRAFPTMVRPLEALQAILAADPYEEFRLAAGAKRVVTFLRDRLISFHGQCCAHQNDVWAETNANGVGGTSQWVNVIPNGAPGSPAGRHNNSAVYDPVNNRLIIYGGCLGGCFPIANDVWVLINANGLGGAAQWQQLFPSGSVPQARQGHSAVYDSTTNTMTIFGGQNGSCCESGILTDTWVLTNANGLGGTPVWTQIAGSNSGIGAYLATTVYDGASATMTAFGGVLFGSGSQSNAVWTLSHANGQGGPAVWSQQIPGGDPNSPPARASHSAVYDPIGNKMTIFGGANVSGTTSDVWTLYNANGLDVNPPSWTQLGPNGGPPAVRTSHSAAFDPGTYRMIVFSGSGFDGNYSSTWVLQF